MRCDDVAVDLVFRKTGDTRGQLVRVDPNKAVTEAPDLKFLAGTK